MRYVTLVPFRLVAIFWVWVVLMCLVPLALFAAGPGWGVVGLLASIVLLQQLMHRRKRRA